MLTSKKNAARTSIIIDGVTYPSIKDACENTHESRFIIKSKLMASIYRYEVNHDDEVKKQLDSIPISKGELIAYRNQSYSMGKIAEIHNINRSTVQLAFIGYGIDTTYQQISESVSVVLDSKESLEELYRTKTTDQIALQLGVCAKTIQNRIREHGIPMKYSQSESAIERELCDYIHSLGFVCLMRDKSLGIELDLFIPSKNLGIELDGLVFHATDAPRNDGKKDHQKKTLIGRASGITLLRFVDVGETNTKLDLVKSMICSKLGIGTKIWARKCKVVSLKNSDVRLFMEQNHMSGHVDASVTYGLVHNDQLVQVMSFSKTRFRKDFDWEIIRMASLDKHCVVGGASKLFKHFLMHHTGSVMSYANLRFGSGKVYESLGFVFSGITQPGYFYTNLKQNFSRFKFQRGTIEKMCHTYDPTKTEAENAKASGFFQYPDAGNAIYLYHRPN